MNLIKLNSLTDYVHIIRGEKRLANITLQNISIPNNETYDNQFISQYLP